MQRIRIIVTALFLFAALAVAAPAQTRSLYERLGGEDALKAVVDDVVTRAAADTRINQKFAKTDIPRLKFHLVKQLCQVTGGPCKDIGRTPEKVHDDLKITGGEFTAFVEDLTATLNKFNVGQPEQSELLGILGSLKPKIVEVPDSTTTGTPLPSNFKPAKPLKLGEMTEEKLKDGKMKDGMLNHDKMKDDKMKDDKMKKP